MFIINIFIYNFAFSLHLYIKKLCPQLEKRNFITVNINGKAQANPNLLAFAYVVSLLEGKNPTEFEFEENDIMID